MKASYGRYAIIGALAAAFLAAMTHVNIVRGLEQTEPVVVISKQVQPYQLLEESHVKVEQRPVGAAGPGAFQSIDQVKGRYAKGLMVPGDIVREAHVAEAAGGHIATQLTTLRDPDVRAMALEVETEAGVGYTVQSGDRVDILVSVTVATDTGGETTYSKIIAHRVPVIHTTFGKSDSTGSSSGSTVILQVTPELAEEIAFAKGSGTLWLLTTPEGAGDRDTAGMDMEAFKQKHGLAVATPAAQQAMPAPGAPTKKGGS